MMVYDDGDDGNEKCTSTGGLLRNHAIPTQAIGQWWVWATKLEPLGDCRNVMGGDGLLYAWH